MRGNLTIYCSLDKEYTKSPSTATPLNVTDIKRIQSINGTFLYYGQAIDPTLLLALNEISITQSAPTTDALNKCNQF
jgi:hypothetical protein